MKIINKTKNTILAQEVILANTLFKRIKGLLGRKEFYPPEALILEPCNSIHTFFMKFPIDVVFLNKQNIVIKTLSFLKPWRLSGIYFTSFRCIELPAGTLKATSTEIGDYLFFEP
jgi:uncharacterized membrane protein (UPF0127 family)